MSIARTEPNDTEVIAKAIHFIRGRRVILDEDLAQFYGVATHELNKSVSRNRYRFPADFAFLLTPEEAENLRGRLGTSTAQHGGRRKLTQAFTEQGVAMLAGVLRTPRAVSMSIAIIRAFVRLRELLAAHKELAAKLHELETKLGAHDDAIANLFETIRQLIAPADATNARKIGFHQGNH